MLFSISSAMWQSHLYRIKPITARCYSYHSFKNIKFQHNLAFYWSSKICLHTTSISATWTRISLKFALSLKTRRISGCFNAPATYYRLVRFVAGALKQFWICCRRLIWRALFGVDSRGSDGTGCFRIKNRTDTAEFTNLRISLRT